MSTNMVKDKAINFFESTKEMAQIGLDIIEASGLTVKFIWNFFIIKKKYECSIEELTDIFIDYTQMIDDLMDAYNAPHCGHLRWTIGKKLALDLYPFENFVKEYFESED